MLEALRAVRHDAFLAPPAQLPTGKPPPGAHYHHRHPGLSYPEHSRTRPRGGADSTSRATNARCRLLERPPARARWRK
eukprot:6807068-Pyramimonas_sp.AAC.1